MSTERATSAIDDLVAQLRDGPDARVVVVTGAGISHASGIPTFRGSDAGAVWANDVMAKGTFGFFQHDPVESWRWYLSRFDGLREAVPNPAHEAVAALERWHADRGGEFLLITQNVDLLHERAGSSRMVKVHGSADRVRCATRGCELGEPRGSMAREDVDFAPFVERPAASTLPRCPACDGLVRPHVLWFDELYDAHQDYGFERVMAALGRAELLLFVGTSFAVGVTELALDRGARSGAAMFSVDPSGLAPTRRVRVIRDKAEVALVTVTEALLG